MSVPHCAGLVGGGSVRQAVLQISVQWADTSTSQGESDSFSFANKTLGFLPVLVLAFLFVPTKLTLLSLVTTAHTQMQFFFSSFIFFLVTGRLTLTSRPSSVALALVTRAVFFFFVLSILLISAAQTTCRPIGGTPRTATRPQGRSGRLPLTPPPRAALPNTTSTPNPLPVPGPWRRVQSPSPPARPLRRCAGRASPPRPRPLYPLPPPPPRLSTSIRTPSPAACTSPSTARLVRPCMRPHQTQTLRLFTSKPHWC